MDLVSGPPGRNNGHAPSAVPDVESAILRGRIGRVYHDDPRGPRYRVVGTAADLMTNIAVVVRLVPTDRVLVVTVFVLEMGDE